jgi:hypothetical protein
VKFRPFDFVAFFVALAVLVTVSVYTFTGRSGPTSVRIESASSVWLYPVEEDRHISVAGPLGETVVEIRDGTARVLRSPCPHKICISMGEIRDSGEWVACLPNRVFIRIEGGERDEVDATTY